MNIASFSLRHPQLLLVAVGTAVVWGGIALVTLPRQEEPTITWRLANVVTRLPGASPARMESLVTDLVEKFVEQVDEVEHVYSVSRAGVSLVQVELSDAVTEAEPVWQKVRHKLAEAALELPAGALGPDLDDEIMGTFAVLAAVTGDWQNYRHIEDAAQALEDRLRYLPDTASTSLFGVQKQVIEVEVDPAKLAAYDLSFDAIANVLRGRNTRRPSGRLRVDQGELLVETSGEFQSEEDIADVVLAVTSTGRTLRVGDAAGVRRTIATPPEPLARVNGQRTILVGARARQGVRIDAYGDRVAAVINRFDETLPDGISCRGVHDLARYTRERTAYLSRTMLLSVAAVFLATALFMGWRGATVVTAAIPVTGLVVLVLFSVTGVPLNQMSVMAIIMAMGMLVDDAIIVTEEIHRRAKQGESLRNAAGDVPAQLAAPLVVSTLTTLAAFLPIYLLPGGVGEFVRAIPIGVGICLLTALLVAVTVVPWMAARLLSAETNSMQGMSWFQRLSQWSRGRYETLLRALLARPATSLAAVVIAMAGFTAIGLTLRRDFFSPVERDQFVIDVFAPQGSAVAHTEEIVAEIEAILAEDAAVINSVALVGRNAPLVFYNLTSQETYANHFAQILVAVDDPHKTATVAGRIQTLLDAGVAGAHCAVHILEHGAPLVAPFEVRISGPSIETLQELGRRAGILLADTPGLRNIRDNFGNEAVKLVSEVNEPVARAIGIDQQRVADELRGRLDGLAAGFLQEGDDRIEIRVRLPQAKRDDIGDLDEVYFKPAADTRLIPFSTVAAISPDWETASIYRRDGRRTLSVLAYPRFGSTAAQVAARFLPRLEAFAGTMPPGYSLEMGGENEQRHEAESNLLSQAVYAVCLVAVLLVWEFRSFRLPALILAVVPLSIGGTMVGLAITGWPLNFMAIMGMIMLIGVVVNDALVLVDGFEKRRAAIEPAIEPAVKPTVELVVELVVAGTLERSRHIVITTVTTVAGFLPLAVSPSLLWPPLAIAIIGGLTLATLLTLIAVPAGYVLLHRCIEGRGSALGNLNRIAL